MNFFLFFISWEEREWGGGREKRVECEWIDIEFISLLFKSMKMETEKKKKENNFEQQKENSNQCIIISILEIADISRRREKEFCCAC